MIIDPSSRDENAIRGQLAYLKERRNKAPTPRPGDKYIVFFTLLGVVIGLYFGIRSGMPLWMLIGLIGGGIAGSIIGSLVKAIVLNVRKSRDRRRYS